MTKIEITSQILLDTAEIQWVFIASSGPGGQNVNKVATAAQLRFNVWRSASLTDEVRQRMITLLGARLTGVGDLIIKANSYRTQERNKQDAIERLCQIIKRAAIPPKKRKKTRPTLASKRRRLESKKLQSNKKALRQDKSG